MFSAFNSSLTRVRNCCLVWPSSVKALLTHPLVWCTVGGVASVLIARAMSSLRNNEKSSSSSHKQPSLSKSSECSSAARPDHEDNVTAARDKYLNMNLEEKREQYKCKDFITLDKINPWSETKTEKKTTHVKYPFSDELNKKISIFVGDITALEIDAVVNAANSTLMGGGGVDGCIHRAAGPQLRKECATLGGCETGSAKLTGGYRLPAKYILHAVGPIGEKSMQLKKCYETCLDLAYQKELKTLAFPCISTGIYGYPNELAAHVAIKTVRDWLEKKAHADSVDRIIFCLFLNIDMDIYQRLLHQYFPLDPPPTSPTAKDTPAFQPVDADQSEEKSDEDNARETPPKMIKRDKDVDPESNDEKTMPVDTAKEEDNIGGGSTGDDGGKSEDETEEKMDEETGKSAVVDEEGSNEMDEETKKKS